LSSGTSVPFSPAVTPNTLTWNYSNIEPFETRYIDAYFTINTPTEIINTPVVGGDIMTYTTAITPLIGDATSTNNIHVFNDLVVNAYDPNDVTCFEGDKISLAQVPDDLTYRIRFQNTGSAAATNILVRNDIHPDLDLSTLQLIASSHPHTTTVTSATEIKFTFLNINLPDSTSDEPGSNGWVLYKIKPKNTSVLGDVFENTASIYFDYNAPIITNTATTTVSATTFVPDDNFEQALIDLGYDSRPLDDYVFTSNVDTITSLDVSNENIANFMGIESFTSLSILDASTNALTALNLNSNINLTRLAVNNNLLTAIDLRLHVDLIAFNCFQNPSLAYLNLKNGNNVNMNQIDTTQCPSLTCIEVDDSIYATNTWTTIDGGHSFGTDCSPGLTYVPDDNFENYLERRSAAGTAVSVGDPSSMGNGFANDNYVTTAAINAVTYLNIHTRGIRDLTGIEDFTALSSFYCFNNQITTLDLSSNLSMREIFCYNNSITSINLTQNANLKLLQAGQNQLTTLDVSQNPLLENLFLRVNQLTSLDVTQNPNLIRLRCSTTQLISLDVSQNSNLIELSCYENQLVALDVSQNLSLFDLVCFKNQITTLDLSQNTSLLGVRCADNQLTSLDLRNGNNINFNLFNTTNNPNLSCIEVDDAAYSTTNWTNIDPASIFSQNCSALSETYVPDDNFETYLEANGMGNGIASDDYVTTANINAVIALDVNNQSIADLTGIEDFAALQNLVCYQNQLTAIDLTQNINLEDLHCGVNLLTSLDVSQNPLLTYLVFGTNQITSIDLTNNTNLTYLGCYTNQLTTIDLSQNTSLVTFEGFNNSFVNLDFSNNLSLSILRANNNQLSSLNVSLNTALIEVRINVNRLTSLNVKNTNNTNFTVFNSSSNPNLTCVEADDAAWSAINWTSIDAASTFVNNQAECALLSIAGDDEVRFDMYPNPVSTLLTIYTEKEASYTFKNLAGQIILTGHLQVGDNSIDVSALAVGLYFIHTRIERSRFIDKIWVK
jgi:hypothetical protein